MTYLSNSPLCLIFMIHSFRNSTSSGVNFGPFPWLFRFRFFLSSMWYEGLMYISICFLLWWIALSIIGVYFSLLIYCTKWHAFCYSSRRSVAFSKDCTWHGQSPYLIRGSILLQLLLDCSDLFYGHSACCWQMNRTETVLWWNSSPQRTTDVLPGSVHASRTYELEHGRPQPSSSNERTKHSLLSTGRVDRATTEKRNRRNDKRNFLASSAVHETSSSRNLFFLWTCLVLVVRK